MSSHGTNADYIAPSGSTQLESDNRVSSTLDSPNTEESPDVIAGTPSTPNIHIGHMYVYNFSPEPRPMHTTMKYQSPAASSGPICRICHEGDVNEDLISICRCTGTVGLVHSSCMEKWLSLTHTNECEICFTKFKTVRTPKSVFEWIRSMNDDPFHRRSLLGDLVCFVLLTALAITGSFLCVEGAKRQVMFGSSLEAGCLMALATFLLTIYLVWNVFTLKYHFKHFLIWRTKNQNVKIVRVPDVSNQKTEEQSTTRSVPQMLNLSENEPETVSNEQDSTNSNRNVTSNQYRNISTTVLPNSAENFSTHVTRFLETVV